MRQSAPVANIVRLPVDDLREAPFYSILFPVERDRAALRASFAAHGFKHEHPLVVRRPFPGEENVYEVVAGWGRRMMAHEVGLREVPCIVKEFDSEAAARRYAVEDNLHLATAGAAFTLPQIIVLAKEQEAQGGSYSVQQILGWAGVKESTYKHALKSVKYALAELRNKHPRFAGLGDAEIVAECLHNNLWPEFSEFYLGRISVNTFYYSQYKASPAARNESDKQRRLKSRRQPSENRRPEPAATYAEHNQQTAPTQAGREAPPSTAGRVSPPLAGGEFPLSPVKTLIDLALRVGDPERSLGKASKTELLETYAGREEAICQALQSLLKLFRPAAQRTRRPDVVPQDDGAAGLFAQNAGEQITFFSDEARAQAKPR